MYIVMELIEGASLAEHFASLKEKKEVFSEERIWNIFFQVKAWQSETENSVFTFI